MKEKDLKDILRSKFKLEEDKYFSDQWKIILNLLFKKIDYFSHPERLFNENDKVIDGKQIGTVKLDDGKQLAIFTVEVADSISIVRNRQGLREIAAQHIDQNIIHGALAFFYNKKQADYRFSFIAKEASINLETGELIKGETKPKRYTYLLGANEACTTAAKRMLVLADKKEKGAVDIKQLKEAFSVEALNKDFFKTYKVHYEKFWKHLADEENHFRAKLIDTEKTDKVKQEKPIRDFTKKLLGRIVFLHFLQKKGWMGCSPNTKDWIDGKPRFMQQLFEDFAKPANFHSQCLTKLFFKTLNTERVNDIFEVKELNGELNGARVPYLNGGLFEPEKNKETLVIDFPSDFFKELLEFFEQYNFTIDENSPDDHEVGIDPEMLGHIFENLLEDNRDKGAFYTPKEIVQYMCKESLIQYLLNSFHEQKDIEAFIRFHTVSPFLAQKENAVLLNQKLDDIKVCDPAIGSGAFPIGMLQEIFEAKRFIYPYLKTNKTFAPADIKKNIIQNSIYGVDLEKGAVDIAQLRFWLSLVVEELNPQPLPNLDYKIMQGNSLLEEFGGFRLDNLMEDDIIIVTDQEQLTFGSEFEQPNRELTIFDEVTKQQLGTLIEKFYDPIAWEKKTGERVDKIFTKKSINEIIEGKIHAFVLSEKRKLTKDIDEKKKKWDIINNDYSKLNQKSKDFKTFRENKVKLEKLDSLEQQLITLQDSEEKPFFLWHTWFKKDVFEKGGFDVIIGNPPYIQLQKDGGNLAKLYQAHKYETFERRGDIYSLFYEKGVQLLNQKGVLCFITSNKWMRANYGASTRQFFVNKTHPLLLIDFANIQIFDTATVDTNILLLQNKPKAKKYETKKLIAVRINNDFNFPDQSLNTYVARNGYALTGLNHNAWVVGEKDVYNIKEFVEKQGVQLKDWQISINYGVKTGLNKAFIIPDNIKNTLVEEDPNSINILKPILRGKDISSWFPDYNGFWLIATFPSLNVNIDEYPFIKKFLLSVGKSRLEQNGSGRKKTGNKWFETQDQISYWENFETPKVIYPNMTKYLPFVYDESNNFYSNDKSYILTGKHLKYLTCFFNSKLFKFCFSNNFPELQGGTKELRKVFFDKIPVKQITNEQEVPFAKMVDYLVALKKENSTEPGDQFMFIYFEQIANALVYELYFKEEFAKEGLEVAKHVAQLPNIESLGKESVILQIRKAYIKAHEQGNPIRDAVESIISIPQINLINNSVTI